MDKKKIIVSVLLFIGVVSIGLLVFLKPKSSIEIPNNGQTITENGKLETDCITFKDTIKKESKDIDAETISQMTEEELTLYKGEGKTITIGEDIEEGYIDAEGNTLPIDPRDDIDFQTDWSSCASALEYIALPLEDITYCNVYHFYIDKEAVESGFLDFMKKYLQRSVEQATAKYISDPDLKYIYELNKLEVSDYPEEYPVSDTKDLIELVFLPSIVY